MTECTLDYVYTHKYIMVSFRSELKTESWLWRRPHL